MNKSSSYRATADNRDCVFMPASTTSEPCWGHVEVRDQIIGMPGATGPTSIATCEGHRELLGSDGGTEYIAEDPEHAKQMRLLMEGVMDRVVSLFAMLQTKQHPELIEMARSSVEAVADSMHDARAVDTAMRIFEHSALFGAIGVIMAHRAACVENNLYRFTMPDSES